MARPSASRWRSLRRPAARGLALALALVALAGHLGTYLHLATVRHGRCADHDELVELGPGAGSAHAAHAAPAATARPEGTQRIADAPAAGHGHGDDHCAFSPFRRSGVVTGGGCDTVGAAPPGAPAPLARAADGVRLPVIAILRLAPKTPPPAA